MNSKPVQMWERQPYEKRKDKAWNAFLLFRNLGSTRTIDKAHAEWWTKKNPNSTKPIPSEAPSHWKDWSRLHHWVERARAYDNHLNQLADEEYKADQTLRRQQLRRQEWDDAQRLRALWTQALNNTSLHINERTGRREETLPDGTIKVTEIVFAKLDVKEMQTFARWRLSISDLERRSLDMSTSITDVTSKGEKLQTGLAVDDMAELFKQMQQHKGQVNAGDPHSDT